MTNKINKNKENDRLTELGPPKCHFTEMEWNDADDIGCTVEYWECLYCGHTKEICREYREGG